MMSNGSLGDIDLNFPQVEETSTSTNRQGGSIDFPIVVEGSDNDVQALSALESSHQRTDQSSRNHQVAAEPEAVVEAPPLGPSDLILVSNLVATMSNESRRDIDLNFPLVEETSTSNNRQGGSIDLPIVLEESNNDVQVLSALESSHQRVNQSSRNHQVPAEPEAMAEVPPLGQSGVGAKEPVSTISSLNVSAGEDFFTLSSPRIASNQEGISAGRNSTIRELNLSPVLESARPSFRCPICLNSLRNPISTHCGHIFCESCFHRALSFRRAKICPICRKKQSSKKRYHPVYFQDIEYR